ncbi:cytochrome b-c1 complex subunit 10 [Hyperolius riggenbachi]|uniref:cytochrome b-c1 complex subunit 10 n=1 Tax=Hyperolius riggenbachi TaxID=752182 RepID=UPI0035A386BB
MLSQSSRCFSDGNIHTEIDKTNRGSWVIFSAQSRCRRKYCEVTLSVTQRQYGRSSARSALPATGKELGTNSFHMVTWGTVGGVGFIWATDWKLILNYVPYINGKFKKDE